MLKGGTKAGEGHHVICLDTLRLQPAASSNS